MTPAERRIYEDMMGKDFFETDIGKDFMTWFDDKGFSLDDSIEEVDEKLGLGEDKERQDKIAELSAMLDELLGTEEPEDTDEPDKIEVMKAMAQDDCREEFVRENKIPEALVDMLEGCIAGSKITKPTYAVCIVCHGEDVIIMDPDNAMEYRMTNTNQPLAQLIAHFSNFVSHQSCDD